jgi:hypothetical protein
MYTYYALEEDVTVTMNPQRKKNLPMEMIRTMRMMERLGTMRTKMTMRMKMTKSG